MHTLFIGAAALGLALSAPAWAAPPPLAAPAPRVEPDLQIALYAAVARQLASEWGVPDDVAAGYVYVQHAGVHRDRAFIGDRAMLAIAPAFRELEHLEGAVDIGRDAQRPHEKNPRSLRIFRQQGTRVEVEVPGHFPRCESRGRTSRGRLPS